MDLKSFLQYLELEKYHDVLVKAGLDTTLKLSSASDGHLKYLGIPMGPRKKMKGLGEGPVPMHGHGGEILKEQTVTAGFSQKSEHVRSLYQIANVQPHSKSQGRGAKTLWQASSARSTGEVEGPGFDYQHLIRLGKENSPLDQTTSLSLHHILRSKEEQEVKAAIEQSLGNVEEKDQRNPGFIIVAREEARPKTVVQPGIMVGTDCRGQRQASDDVLGRLRGLRAELRAAEDLVETLRQMISEAERDAMGGSMAKSQDPGTRTELEVIEID